MLVPRVDWRPSSPSVLSNSVSLGKDASSSSTYISSSEMSRLPPFKRDTPSLLQWRGGCSSTSVGSGGDAGRVANLRSARPSTHVRSIGVDTMGSASAHSVQIAMNT